MARLERFFQWLGGALFIFSLLVLVMWFAVALDAPRQFAGWPPLVVDLVLFSLFATHHSLLARPAAKRLVGRAVPDRLLRTVYVWTASMLLMAVCLLWQPIGGELYRVPFPAAILFATVQIGGLGLILRSVVAIDALELAGIRSGHGESLQTGGPYIFVRHPLYLGWLLTVFGAPDMTGDRFWFALVSTSYLLLAVPWEERSLQAAFGETYTRYKARVRWRIIPMLY